jgi:HAD superfamily hydrolase (TIGR01490 family)
VTSRASGERALIRPAAGSPQAAGAAAFFDVDGTLVGATIATYYIYLATRGRSALRRTLWLAGSAPRAAYYLALDRMSRGAFNRAFYRNYRGWRAAEVRALAGEVFATVVRPRLHPAGVARVAAHRAAGERVVLVSGSLDFIVAPLADVLGVAREDALCVALAERDGICTGELTGPPLSSEAKAAAVRAFAGRHGIDLARSHAYGDAAADLPMLATVGHPVAVNPDRALRRTAVAAGWPIVAWAPAPSPGGGS